MRNNEKNLTEKKEKIEKAFARKINGIKIQNEVLKVLENQIKPYHLKYLTSKHYKEITESIQAVFKAKNIQCYFVKDSAHTKLFLHSAEIRYTSYESECYFYFVLHNFNEKFKTERLDVDKMTEEIKEKIQENNKSIEKLKHEKISLVNIANAINEKIEEAEAIAKNITGFTSDILRREYMINRATYLEYLLK